jgi:OOP family OmpA-OmpF porin
MKKNYKRLSTVGILMLPLLIVSCSSGAPKADLPANANPNEEITKLDQDIQRGDKNDFAVLDQKDFQESRDHLASAKDKLNNNKDQADVLEQVRISRGYYNRAETVSNERRGHIQTVIDARELAVNSGALQYPQTRQQLEKVDADARSIAESSDTPASEKVSALQKRYGEVQLSALTTQQLGSVKATIDAAKDQDATSIAPKTFNQAKVDYDNAVNAISMNRANVGEFMGPVKQAQLSGDTLARVMAMQKQNPKSFNEDQAVRIVQQDRRIHSLDTTVTDEQAQKSALEAQKSALATTLSSKTADLNTANMDLNAASKKVAMQKAIQSAQDQFTSQEAEVYQQDNKLLIRLKSIGFASGSAKIPANSEALLDKVQAIVQGLKPEAVVVEGNTDSVGGKAINAKLSEKRADEVASYFEKNGLDSNRVKTVGYGDTKPLASNKTSEGRAQNRRIDIVVTPSASL